MIEKLPIRYVNDGFLVSTHVVPLPGNVFEAVKEMLGEDKEGWIKYRTLHQRIRCTYYDHNFTVEVGGPGWQVRKPNIRIEEDKIILIPHEETELVLIKLPKGEEPTAIDVKGEELTVGEVAEPGGVGCTLRKAN